MTKINNFIELNGKRYDARSGAFLGSASNPVASTKAATGPLSPGGHARSLDGFITKPSQTLAPVADIPVKPAPLHHPVAARSLATKPVAAHRPEHTKTLMRHTVKAPKVARIVQLQAPTDLAKTKPPVLGIKPKLSSEQVDKDRSMRSQNVPRSQSVVRFQPRSPYQSSPRSFEALPAVRPVAAPAQPKSAVRPQDALDLFEQAIIKATSHEQPEHKESRRHKARRNVHRHLRTVSISAAVCAMLLLGGFVAYQNKVALELQLASARAGFPASMPGYRPSGYAAKTLQYSPGTVTIGFQSNTHSYTVTQDKSNWDSETLLQNYVANINQPYLAYQAAGRTVYIYGNGDATWVNGGVWYKVSGNANLGTRQIIDLAASM